MEDIPMKKKMKKKSEILIGPYLLIRCWSGIK